MRSKNIIYLKIVVCQWKHDISSSINIVEEIRHCYKPLNRKENCQKNPCLLKAVSGKLVIVICNNHDDKGSDNDKNEIVMMTSTPNDDDENEDDNRAVFK